MADVQQLKMLKEGVDVWNQWRRNNPTVAVNLAKVDLQGERLTGINLSGADLSWANLSGANLKRAHLKETIMVNVNLSGADLTKAYLKGANLRDALLAETNLTTSNLQEINLIGAWLEGTIFGNNDLSEAKGIEKAKHFGASVLDSRTLQRSQGKLPVSFLRGCGLSDWEIESAKLYQPGLSAKEIDDVLYRIHDLRAHQAIQINPLFISYSHKDSAFVDEMENHLNERGIRFWRDVRNATSGRLEKVVDHAMRQNPTVLLVLSEHSIQSDWVEHEARSARDLEKELKRDVLCPVALDDAWKDCNWPARLREQIMEYNILDFSNWKDESEFAKKFAKLVEGLDLFYKEK